MRFTLCARSKILELSKSGLPFRIQITGTLSSGSHVDLIPNADQTELDVTICHVPHVIADLSSVNFLSGQVVDFNYDDDEFVISNRGAE